ncbi:uncharacterized protein L969DRAFT_47355 [Mixia osmundae IAM 14324]|uniref:CHCH domain-containing protein n=1 Tax=Mixia osmundae (strain CBS 9802 / IAM 14324 / JCM 22182 / KY 12970) TaxID=764103 RepID=G7E9R1_MIXOS|nr:uncharacterized protein L969DRAFT_47355 [Mixia osmundae IAM 14324]KEI40011.1 hypothetical protein L969DRAFT_47355 [Mixia osmundae IAM 14324]GAA99380.1 hypothetical protein E5Q_06076 [Mixia osmundae IAM 14324]
MSVQPPVDSTIRDPIPRPANSQSEVPRPYRELFKNKEASKFVDPCDQARADSMRCLDEQSYNRSACSEFFTAYRDCKKAWLKQRREDRMAGRY